MSETPSVYAGNNRYRLEVSGVDAGLDVLEFSGRQALSEPFCYAISFTSSAADIAAEAMLGKRASFYLGAAAQARSPSVHGVVTGFSRLSASADEARYQLTLQPRLALLGRGRQYRLYQQQSVPEIVEHILREHHAFEGQHFLFQLVRSYPKREQVMQYAESDLAFIERLLAEVGVWYCFSSDDRLHLAVLEFHDDQRHYQRTRPLALRSQSGLASSGRDSAWDLQTCHQVVEREVEIRAYHHRDAAAHLDASVDHSAGDRATYGASYHYADHYRELDDALARDEDLLSESGYFYARLHHERYLNQQTRLAGKASSAELLPGQVIDINGGAPQAFAPGAVLTAISVSAARDRTLVTTFEAIAYSETVCFRPSLRPRPQIAGTLPARVCSSTPGDEYAHIDLEGRYRVNFLFDRANWAAGKQSAWLRLARPYAGDSHGLHLPLIAGTEVAVAFEQGDPDRPYIAHALHDSRHPDHVTLDNYKRNVLRTPANNKLRMDDSRGQEHIKLATEHGGKSQLNLGHLVDGGRQKRGEGFELRTDAWGALRAGKGMFISADGQPKAQGQMLDMADAVAQLNNALELVATLAQSARASAALAADVPAQRSLASALNRLADAGLIASAPKGMALTSAEHLQLSSGANLLGTAGDSADFSVRKRFTVAAGEAISLFAQKLGLKLFAARGPLDIQAQSDAMTLKADKRLQLSSINGEVQLDAAQGITLASAGAYIKVKDGSIEIGAPGEIRVRNDQIQWGGAASLSQALAPMTLQDPVFKYPCSGKFQVRDKYSGEPQPYRPYRIEAGDGTVLRGVTDENGFTQQHHGLDTDDFELHFE